MPLDLAFIDWKNRVMAEMERLSLYEKTVAPGAIDAMIPFQLGWSPSRGARALMALDWRDYKRLYDIQRDIEHRITAEKIYHHYWVDIGGEGGGA